MKKKIILYGSANCHKTKYYIDFFSERMLEFKFYDVVIDEERAKELRGLYDSGKLNFPTIIVGNKRLRNPNYLVLNKWLSK